MVVSNASLTSPMSTTIVLSINLVEAKKKFGPHGRGDVLVSSFKRHSADSLCLEWKCTDTETFCGI